VFHDEYDTADSQRLDVIMYGLVFSRKKFVMDDLLDLKK
jgi:hypothetical protein